MARTLIKNKSFAVSTWFANDGLRPLRPVNRSLWSSWPWITRIRGVWQQTSINWASIKTFGSSMSPRMSFIFAQDETSSIWDRT